MRARLPVFPAGDGGDPRGACHVPPPPPDPPRLEPAAPEKSPGRSTAKMAIQKRAVNFPAAPVAMADFEERQQAPRGTRIDVQKSTCANAIPPARSTFTSRPKGKKLTTKLEKTTPLKGKENRRRSSLSLRRRSCHMMKARAPRGPAACRVAHCDLGPLLFFPQRRRSFSRRRASGRISTGPDGER